jgi:tetratricopeptide (TPR) repeat protein
VTPSRPNPEFSAQPPKLPELELLERIGVGGYGEVWLCRNALGALRAVKIVRRAEFEDERPYEREFGGIRKFEPISRSHEGFVDLLQVGRNDTEGWFYYVMELADRMESSPNYQPRTLAAEVKRRGALPLDESLRIALMLAGALAELHRRELVHRDIKPSNLIFVGGVPKLADIGLVASATDARSFVGTEGFIPPEGPGTPQADLYSLGIVLYVMATGKTHRDFPEPPGNLATRPDRARYLEFSAIIHRACQANPRDRYSNAAAMLADLQRLSAGRSVKRRHSLQRGWAWSWKTAAVIALLAVAVVLVKNDRQRRAILARQNANPWVKMGTTNPAAWQAFQRALQMQSSYTAKGTSNGIAEYERAVALDPNFVGAWSTLSIMLTIAVNEGYLPWTNALPRAKFCVERALQLNPKTGCAYISLAQCNLNMDYDFATAEPLFRKGIALDPTNWTLRDNFAWYLAFYRRFAEAEALETQINQGHPEQGGPYMTRALAQCALENPREGLRLFDEGMRLASYRPYWYLLRGDILWAASQHDAAARDWLREIELDGFPCLDPATDAAALRQVLEERGPESFLQAFIALLEERNQAGRFVLAFDLARLHAHAGHRAKALDYLETAIDEHRARILIVNVDPAFNCLRLEPRFHGALRRLKLE